MKEVAEDGNIIIALEMKKMAAMRKTTWNKDYHKIESLGCSHRAPDKVPEVTFTVDIGEANFKDI